MRLQKYLADCGVASRRKAEVLIVDGRVKVNGEVVTILGTKVSSQDKIEVDNKVVQLKTQELYVMLNKPVGYLSTTQKGREEGDIILDLIDVKQRLYPIGRLDRETSGLLLLTNDGDLALKLTHPRYEKEKEYIVELNSEVLDKHLVQLSGGIVIDKYKTLPAKVEKLSNNKVSIVIKEGKNRQIRKMFSKLNYKIISLQRIRIKNLKLGNLKVGKWRNLTGIEIKDLKK